MPATATSDRGNFL